MNVRQFQLLGVVDPRLASLATSALPAWLWSTDGLRIFWANPVGARSFGAANGAAIAERTFGPADAHRRQVVQLAGRLASIGANRLERLRGFGAPLGALVTCACARLDFADGSHGILIVATQPLRRTMPLIERLQLLVEGFETPVAAFSRDGAFIAASEAGRSLFGFRDLSEAGVDEALSEALANGRVERPIVSGQMVLQRVGSGKDIGLVALMSPSATSMARPDTAAAEAPVEAIVAAESDPEPSPYVEAVADEPSSPASQAPAAVEDASEKPWSHPLRFTWRMDADTCFSLDAGEFTRLIGPETAARFGRPWQELSDAFGLDAERRVLEAIAARNTWSGIAVDWPVDGGERLPVELSGLPIYDTEQNFAGYLGFGVCRDLDSLSQLRELRRLEASSKSPVFLAADMLPTNLQHPAAAHPPATDVVIHFPEPRASMVDETPPRTDLDEAVEPPGNVVPFRPAGEPKTPALTPVEDSAFNELARQLSLQLERDEGGAAEPAVIKEAIDQFEPPPEPPPERPASGQAEWLRPAEAPAHGETRRDRALLDLLPTGVLIYRLDRLLYANPAFLARLGYDSLHALEHAGGLDALYVEAGVSQASSTSESGTPVTISAGHQSSQSSSPAEARLFTISWDGESALALMFTPTGHAASEQATTAAPPVLPEPVNSSPGEDEPPQARLPAESAASAKADLLALISHEVRAPLNTIVGFSEVMIGERFGALGNERYAEYLKDIRTAGERVIVIINDLTELCRIETGKLDLAFASQNLNELVESCVTLMQPQANRERIIIRTSLAQWLPPVMADGRTLRQITMNLIGNSIHLANPAGQVIVSTALSDFGEVVLRVRDTGQGLNDNEVAAALEPFRASPSSNRIGDGAPVNLSLTKALVEANRARFHIRTAGRSGTLVEVVFPRTAARA